MKQIRTTISVSIVISPAIKPMCRDVFSSVIIEEASVYEGKQERSSHTDVNHVITCCILILY